MEKYFEINELNVNIKCKLYYDNIKKLDSIILSCHGFGGSKENAFSKKLSKEIISKKDNFGILTFDWPCHGKDVRQNLNLKDCEKYLSIVINYIFSIFNIDNIYLNATSFGGYLTLKYIKENGNPFKKIVLRCPAINMNDVLFYNILTENDRNNLLRGHNVISGFDRKIKITPELIRDLNSNDVINWDFKEFSDKILIMHGTNDETVPINNIKEFANKNFIDFIEIEGADHRFKNNLLAKEAIEYIVEFITDDGLIIK